MRSGVDATRVLKDGIPCPINARPQELEELPKKQENSQPNRGKAKQSLED